MTRKTYVLRDGKLVEKHLAAPLRDIDAPLIMPDIDPFKSPITGEVISSRPKLHRHMKEHGVTRAEDYSQAYYDKATAERQKRLLGQTPHDRKDRIEALKYALEKTHGR